MPKILIAEDNSEMRETLEQLFNFYKFSVITAENGKIAVQKSKEKMPDVILLDAHMPVMDGFTACKKIKGNNKTKEIPVVFLSAKFIEADNKITGFELGADDYLLKPFNSKELVTRINAILHKNHVLKELRVENEELSYSNLNINKTLQQLKKSKPDDSISSLTDSLTGLYNNNYFLLRLKEEFNRSIRFNIYFTVILIEIDEFKRIVKNYGIQLGDYILMKMANIILNNTRVVDISSRDKNGDFRILLPQTESNGGRIEAQKLKNALESENYKNAQLADLDNVKRKRKLDLDNIQVSMGIKTFPTDKKVQSEKKLLSLVEDDLNKAKAANKN
jgi:diguanylate cyclase (GGDEF)-like protein